MTKNPLLARQLEAQFGPGGAPAELGRFLHAVEAKYAELDLAHSRLARARAAAQAQSDLLAALRREFHAPLDAVRGVTALLLDAPLTHGQRDAATTVRSAGEALRTRLDDVLDHSRLESRGHELELRDFDPRRVIDEAVDSLGDAVVSEVREMFVLIAPDVPRRVVGDAGRLRQVLRTMLGNAARFTTEGEIVVRAGVVREHDLEVRLRFEVEDTGPGILPELRERLFERGALALCRLSIEAMDGALGADSRPGLGSRFWFEVSFEKRASPTAATVVRDELHGKRVLVVDDRLRNRELVEQHLGELGLLVASASGRLDAFECVRAAHAAGTPFDLALIDQAMPAIHGTRLTLELRTWPSGATMPVVLMVSAPSPRLQAEASALRLAGLLAKPLRALPLERCVRGLLGSHADTALAPSSPAVAPRQRAARHTRARNEVLSPAIAALILERMGDAPDEVGVEDELAPAHAAGHAERPEVWSDPSREAA